MFKCLDCDKVYKEKPDYCDCGNNTFEEIITTVVDDLEDPYASKLLSPIKEFFAKNHVLEFEYNE